jgi:hypothetical protein
VVTAEQGALHSPGFGWRAVAGTYERFCGSVTDGTRPQQMISRSPLSKCSDSDGQPVSARCSYLGYEALATHVHKNGASLPLSRIIANGRTTA